MARRTRLALLMLLLLQAGAHLFWLSPSAHSGQVAIPWMLTRGMTLFGDIWEQHAPGASLLGAAALWLLPLTPALAIKVLNTLLTLAFTLLIFLLAQRVSGRQSAGLAAAFVWAWWEPVYANVMLYFDSLLALCVMLALLLYWGGGGGLSARRAAGIGLILGAATLFKQHAWLSLALMALWLLLTERRRLLLPYLAAAVALPLLQWAFLWAGGLWDNYLFWNWTFNLAGYMDGVPLDGDFFRKLLLSNILVLPFAALAWARARRELLLLALWLAALSLLYPRFGEIHAMGHLPLAAVMSGSLLATLLPSFRQPPPWDAPRIALAGLAAALGIGWLWTGAVSYIPTELGAGKTLAWHEFDALAAELNGRKAPGDTLYILPQTDSSPQLHPRTDMLPPGTWVKGWRWYFRPAQVLPQLLAEWAREAPTWVVVFPAFIRDDDAEIRRLLAWVQREYHWRFAIDGIFAHGRADVYRLNAGQP